MLLWFLALLPPVFTRSLWEPDDARYAEIAREMEESGDYGTPRLLGIPYPDKPPLSYWLTCLSLKVFGANEFAVRLPALLCGLATVLAMLRYAGFRAAAILATCALLLGVSQSPILDGPLSAFVILSILHARARLNGGPRGHAWLSWVWMALAVDVKGPVGLAPLPIVVAALVIARRAGELRKLDPLPGFAIFAALVVPVYALVELRIPGFIQHFLVGQNLRGLANADENVHHGRGFLYAPAYVAGGFMPWMLALPPALAWAWKRRARWRDFEAVLPLAWFFVIFGVFAVSRSKLATYFLPAFPPLALLVGKWWEDGAPMRRGWAALWALAGLAAPVGVPLILDLKRLSPVLAADPRVGFLVGAAAIAFAMSLLLVARLIARGRPAAALAGVVGIIVAASAASSLLLPPLGSFRTVGRPLLDSAREPLVVFETEAAGVAFYRRRVPGLCGLTRDYEPLGRSPELLWPPERLGEAGSILTTFKKIPELEAHLKNRWRIIRSADPHVLLAPLKTPE